MKSAVIVHGKPDREKYFDPIQPSPSNAHWLSWLQKQFLMTGYLAQTPEMPEPWAPNYQAWRRTFERFPVDGDTVLVGHSCGGGFLLRWLSKNRDASPKRVLLVAPWLDPDHEVPDLFRFDIDPALARRTELHVLHSHDDMPSIVRTIPLIQAALPDAHYHWFENHGHFCFNDMGTDAFPALARLALG